MPKGSVVHDFSWAAWHLQVKALHYFPSEQ